MVPSPGSPQPRTWGVYVTTTAAAGAPAPELDELSIEQGGTDELLIEQGSATDTLLMDQP